VLAPCAIERVIDGELARRLRCRIIAEGANGPTTPKPTGSSPSATTESSSPATSSATRGGASSYFEWVQDFQQHFRSKDEVMDRLE
jgi:glutamate dehydrogenase (NAD(P)+)